MTPFTRLVRMLKLDRKDLFQILFYAAFSGVISLSLPLGIQAIINFIQSGRVSVSWMVMVGVVVMGVVFIGILSLMQLRITENLQQKIFVRSSYEFAYRLPKIRFFEMDNIYYPPGVANRFFDTLTLQKGISKLLLDFSSALLQIIVGMVLLSLYHPYFVLFGVVLVIVLFGIFRYSYPSGVATSLEESKVKYRVADWLQEIARNHLSFRKALHFDYALKKNDILLQRYIGYREKHFKVLQRQFTQLVIFKVLITATLLVVGGFLVIDKQLNIGQFVAAEIIILLVINSVEKIILGLETFYDVLTSVEKIGEVTDMELEDAPTATHTLWENRISLEAENLSLTYPQSRKETLRNISLKIEPGEKVIVTGRNGSGKTSLIRVLSAIVEPTSGILYLNDAAFRKLDYAQYRSRIGVILQGDTPFEGTLLENITFNDPMVSDEDVRWALEAVQLAPYIKTLPDGLDTRIYPDGRQVTSSNAQKILLARSIVRRPNILFYEDPTARMDEESASGIIDFLFAPENQWTVVVSSANPHWKARATRLLEMENGEIINDLKCTPHA